MEGVPNVTLNFLDDVDVDMANSSSSSRSSIIARASDYYDDSAIQARKSAVADRKESEANEKIFCQAVSRGAADTSTI